MKHLLHRNSSCHLIQTLFCRLQERSRSCLSFLLFLSQYYSPLFSSIIINHSSTKQLPGSNGSPVGAPSFIYDCPHPLMRLELLCLPINSTDWNIPYTTILPTSSAILIFSDISVAVAVCRQYTKRRYNTIQYLHPAEKLYRSFLTLFSK